MFLPARLPGSILLLAAALFLQLIVSGSRPVEAGQVPGSSAAARQARQHLQSGRISEARDTLLNAIERGERDPVLYLLAGQVLAEVNETGQALQILHKGIREFPTLPEMSAALGSIQLQSGRFDEAIQSYQSAVDLSSAGRQYVDSLANAYFQKALALFRNRDRLAGLSAARKAVELSPEQAPFQHLLGVTNFVLKQHTDAREALDKAVALDPDNSAYLYDLALVLLETKEISRAQALLEESLKLDPDFAMAHVYLGRLYHNQNQVAPGLAHFESALALEPDLLGVRYHIGYAYKALGDDQRAVLEMKKELEKHPDFEPALVELGDLYLRLGDGSSAAGPLAKAVQLGPQNARAHYLLGRALVELNRLDEALRALQASVQLNPVMPEPEYTIAQIYMKQGKMELAQIQLEIYSAKKARSTSP